jgi:hypothetical protein
MKELVQLANNNLLYRIWNVLNEYVTFICKSDQEKVFSNEKLEILVTALLKKDQNEVFAAYKAVSLKEYVE